MSKTRNFIGTMWNMEELDKLKNYKYLLVGAEETCPTTGKKHHHVVVCFRTPRAIVRTGTTEWERVKSLKAAIEYASKEGVEKEEGRQPKIDQTYQSILADSLVLSKAQMADKYGMTYLIRERQCDRYKQIKRGAHEITEGALENKWYWGEAGTGKSKKAFGDNPGAYIKNSNKWWDGYDDQDVVIIDDLDPDTAKPLTRYLKIWSDRYPFQAEYKGGSRIIQGVKLIVTSNYSPEEIWSGADLEAIKRRFKTVHFKHEIFYFVCYKRILP